MMTEETLNKIIEGVKKQLRHEEKCIEAIKMIFPESYPPVPSNPLWQAFETAVDAALGVEDFFDWWIWETDCGTNDRARIRMDEVCYPVTNAKEILAYAEAERKIEGARSMWTARDEDRTLGLYFNKPEKQEDDDGEKRWAAAGCSIQLPPDFYPEVKWEDEEPRELILK